MPELREPLRRFFAEEPEHGSEVVSVTSWWNCPAFSTGSVPLQLTEPTQKWEEGLRVAFGKLVETIASRRTEHLPIARLAKEVEDLKGRVQRLEQPGSIIVPINTLEPEPFDLLKPIYVVVQPSDDEYIASFFDANVNAGGCNETEAVQNLKDVMVSLFEYLSDQPAKKLGPAPTRQLAVLRGFIRKRG